MFRGDSSPKFQIKGCEKMLEYDQFRLQLEGMEKGILELSDSL